MLNDFIPVVNNMPITEHPDKQLTIIPIADAHYGSPEFNEVRWHNVIKRIQDDPHCFCVLVGDLVENSLKTSVGNSYAATASPFVQKEWLRNELKPIAPKILAAVGGNHERRTIREVDQDPLYDVMLQLGIEDKYRQNICFMQVRIAYDFKGKTKQRAEWSFAITHGTGAGQYIGSSANKVQTFGMAIDGIDCLITGHTHKPVTFPAAKLVFEHGAVVRRQFVVAVASSFLDYGGYPIQKLMTPTAQTTTEITLTYYNDGQKKIKVTQE